jgi:hypothetical protein
VDDLMVSDLLEKYVSQTQSVLFFLSDGYFASQNCHREVIAALDQRKPIVLLCDGMLESPDVVNHRKHACQQRLVESIFGTRTSPREVIPWVRARNCPFQRESIRRIAMAVFGETPLRRRRSAELRIADEVRLQAMIFIPSVTLQFSHNNPGAEEAAKELTQVVENLSIAPLPPRQSREETDFVPKTEEDAPARKFSLLSAARPRAGSIKADGRMQQVLQCGRMTEMRQKRNSKKRLKSCCKPGFNLAQLALSAGAAGKAMVVPREGWENQTVGGWRKALANNKSKGDKSKGGSPNGSFNKGRDRQSGPQVLPRSSSCKARRKSSRYLPHRSDVFLLYLNNTTFLGPEGAELTAELHELMDQGGTQFVVVHEADPERAACNFAQYFQVAA